MDTNTHLLLKGLQVHISICVVDSCRWTEDFNSRNLFCLQGHMKQKSYDTCTLFHFHLHFLPPSGARFTKWDSSRLPLNDMKVELTLSIECSRKKISLYRFQIQKQYIFAFPFSCISWCRLFCFYFPDFWELSQVSVTSTIGVNSYLKWHLNHKQLCQAALRHSSVLS